MYLALDVAYGRDRVSAAGVGFHDPESDRVVLERVRRFEGAPETYEPGNFRKRELPYLEALAGAIAAEHSITSILIDGYVWLGDRAGLGCHLFDSLDRRIPIIGVAKTRFRSAPARELRRGTSQLPLMITSIGVEIEQAVRLISVMHGAHRIPTLLRRVDQLARHDQRERR